jgi:hypothetical protein
VLIGFVPHVPGSEDFSEEQLVDTIARTVYSAGGLRPPADRAGGPGGSGGSGGGAAEERGAAPEASPPPAPVARFQRRAHWIGRGRR